MRRLLLPKKVTETDLSLSDITTGNASTSRHGHMPKLSNDATKFYNGIGTQTVPPGGGGDGGSVASAWINFNGSSAAINGSNNIGSLTRRSTGKHKVVFASALATANFSVGGSARRTLGGTTYPLVNIGVGDDTVKLLCHLDGTNGSTTFTDSSLFVRTMTPSGNAQISTAQSKFGGASGLFDGTGDFVTVPDDSAWNFGTGDFTVAFWLRAGTVNDNRALVGSIDTTEGWIIFINGGPMRFSYYAGGSAQNDLSGATSLTADTWYHVQFVRSGTAFKLYLNGVQDGSITDSTNILKNAVGLLIGRWTGFTGRDYNGYIDDLQILNYALHTSGFTPPASAYSDPDTAKSTTHCYLETTANGALVDAVEVNAAFFA